MISSSPVGSGRNFAHICSEWLQMTNVSWRSRSNRPTWEFRRRRSNVLTEPVSPGYTASGKPKIINSDQGSHFTSSEFVTELRAHCILISMDGLTTSAYRNFALASNIIWNFSTQDGFIRLSNIGRRMKSISELAIGKQWDIVSQGSLHQSFNKSCPT